MVSSSFGVLSPSAPNALAQRTFTVLATLFVVCLVVANLTGAYLLALPLPWGGSQLVSGGILTFPLTFVLTDLVNEFYGHTGARWVTWLGLAMTLLVVGALNALATLPASPHTVILPSQLKPIISQFTGMLGASLCAYVLGQFLDIALFGWFKRLTGSRLLWLRATGSTVLSQLLDSFVVTLIAFWGSMPLERMLAIGQGNYAVKLVVVVVATPLLYVAHGTLRRLLRPA
jgi:uncharacterized integral membrane protein (TIGR00697 family)